MYLNLLGPGQRVYGTNRSGNMAPGPLRRFFSPEDPPPRRNLLALAPWMAGVHNNQQGKILRNIGLTIDFSKPAYFASDEYTQHVYMILGRATSLEWTLLRNLQVLPDGSDIDFSVFEHGPPQYIVDFLKRLEDVALGTAVQFLPGFPAADHLPEPIRRGKDGSFVYANKAWPEAMGNSTKKGILKLTGLLFANALPAILFFGACS